MKYPRTARIFRGQLDAAPFAGVFFLVLIFILLASLVYTPGVQIHLPEATGLTAPDKATISMAVDANGRYFFENQMVNPGQLRDQLAARVQASREPLALVVRADKAVTLDTWTSLMKLVGDAGIHDVWGATLPRLFEPAKPAAELPMLAP